MAILKPTNQPFEHTAAGTPVTQDLDISALPGINPGSFAKPAKVWLTIESGDFKILVNGDPDASGIQYPTGPITEPFQLRPGDTLSFIGVAGGAIIKGTVTN